jgi:hypothetical protein
MFSSFSQPEKQKWEKSDGAKGALQCSVCPFLSTKTVPNAGQRPLLTKYDIDGVIE